MNAATGTAPGFSRALLVAAFAVAGMWQLKAMNADILPSSTITPVDSTALRGWIAQAPYDQAALAKLAADAQAQGDGDATHRFLMLAAKLGWRDSPAQMMLIEDAIKHGDAVEVIRRVDGLLRRKPELAASLLPVLHAAADDPGGRQALVDRLIARPPWSATFFGRTDLLPPSTERAHETLLETLAKAGAPPSESEIAPYVALLVRRGEIAHARQVWVSLTRPGGDRILDPDFAKFDPARTTDQPIPFGWTGAAIAGVDMRMETEAEKSSPRALIVNTDGSAFGMVLAQALVLSPGRYRLFVRTPSAAILASGSLAWSVRCLPDGKTVSTAGTAAPPGWQADFTIPTTGCAIQQLSLDARRADTPSIGAARFEMIWAEPLGRAAEARL